MHDYSMATSTPEQKLAFLQPNETATQMLARCKVDPLITGVEFLDRHPQLRPRNVALLTGGSATAKSRILSQIAANCILPWQSQGYEIGGLEASCILVDADLKFDIATLVSVFNARIRVVFADLTEEQFQRASQELLNECIERFHLVRCASGEELLAFLKAMPTKQDEDGPFKFLFIDGCTACGSIAAPRAGTSREGGLTAATVSNIMACHLEAIIACRIAVIATRHSSDDDTDLNSMHKRLIPPGWQDLVTHHVKLSKLQSSPQLNSGRQQWAAQWLLPNFGQQESFAFDQDQICSAT